MNFRARLVERLEHAAVPIPRDEALDRLQTYFELLTRWNRSINLTALPLDEPTADTFDRLFTEPLAAARSFPANATRWFDLGSGGGSPAIPLKVVEPSVHLTMVEARERKAAFLREVVRSLELTASVENMRFEDIANLESCWRQIDVVTVRAVRPDATMFSAASTLLNAHGRLLVFQKYSQSMSVGAFRLRETVQLTDSDRSFLAIYGTS